MKTILSLLLPAGFAAFIALPFNIEIAGSLLFSIGFILLMRADYKRRPKALPTGQTTQVRSSESLRLAA